jgi:hypothetical protein
VDKKSSQDSAALLMLYELQRQGRFQVQEVWGIATNSWLHYERCDFTGDYCLGILE